MIRPPAFWWAHDAPFFAQGLRPLAAAYGFFAARRMAGTGVECGVPVVCVGNFVAGGAGKTPTAICLAQCLAALGQRPAFITRGYGGTPQRAPVRVDPARHRGADVGDEPLLLAAIAPTFVCIDRLAASRAAVVAGAGIIVMDDGLQNPALRKHLRIAVVDGQVGIGNGLSLPAGPLRAPLAAQWPMVDVAVVVGTGEAGEALAREARLRDKPVLTARLVPDPDVAARLAGRKVVAFAGIGRPEKFFSTLAEIGAEPILARSFPDHHRFTEGEIDALVRAADERDALLVTTEKDRVRLPASAPLIALPVRLAFDDAQAMPSLLESVLGRVPFPSPSLG